MNILVINQCAHNKGDRAVLTFVLQELSRNGIANVTVSTSDRSYWQPSDIEVPVSVKFVPWGWNVEHAVKGTSLASRVLHRTGIYPRFWYPIVKLMNSCGSNFSISGIACDHEFSRALHEADLVISTGGHHVTTWLAANAVSPQVFDMALALQKQKQLVLWSQSIGPLTFTTASDAAFVRDILSRSRAIYARDTASLTTLTDFGGSFHLHRTLESVVGLTPLDRDYTPPEQRPPFLGISIYTVKKRSDDALQSYIRTMAAVVDHAVSRGLTPKFFPMALKGTAADDRPTIHKIIAAADHGQHCHVVDQDLRTMDHIREVANCRAFVGHKTHSIIFALISATPVVAIAYHQKSCDFMEQFLVKEFCIADTELTPDNAQNTLDNVLRQLTDISGTERIKALEYAAQVRTDFARMLKYQG